MRSTPAALALPSPWGRRIKKKCDRKSFITETQWNLSIRQAIHNSVIHLFLTDAQPIPGQQSTAPGQLSLVYMLSMTFHDVEHPFGQFRSTMLLPSFLCISLLAEHGTQKSSWFRVNTTLKHQCASNVFLI